jgi:hypothetical protein
MSSNGDPAVSVVVVEDAAVVIASDDSDGDMQASAKSKRKRQKHQFPWEYVKDWQDGDSAKHCVRKAPVHGVSQVVLQIDQCVRLESPHEERARHHR